MSATDSDNSIDWLASDNDDSSQSCWEAERGQTEASPSPGATPRSGHPLGGAAGPCKAQQGEKAVGKNGRQALKRGRGAAAEEDEEGRRERPERERTFGRKCMELQCYIHPLSLILNGLRSGRYRERLSSFQESVAMDRIQRIMGVLQNPCMGEKYINIILKMEEMLKSWFPNVKVQAQLAATRTEDAAPAKKLKLSPATAAAACHLQPPPFGAKALRVTDLAPGCCGGALSANSLKWLHTSPASSPAAEPAQSGPVRPPLAPRDRDLTQDNAVSSSTDTRSAADSPAPAPPPRGRPPGKINAPCLERLLKSTESIITRRESRGLMDSSWS